jgi:hypothetical protein
MYNEVAVDKYYTLRMNRKMLLTNYDIASILNLKLNINYFIL